jgi:transcriptional regulator with XRE-family HTH domain
MALSPSQAFGKAVSELRGERGLSQEDAALRSGIDRAYFGHIERVEPDFRRFLVPLSTTTEIP